MKPNLILITTDHQRHDTIAAAGFKHMNTPHLDRLCQEGTLFSHHFSQSPVCVPSRASFSTGRYPHQINTLWNFSPFPTAESSVFGRLKKAGYTTACIGKHHLVNINNEEHFDFCQANGAKWGLFCEEFRQHLKSRGYGAPEFWKEEEFTENLGALESDRPDDCYIDGWLAEQGCHYLKNVKQPFCLWLGFYGPHHPYDPPKRFREMYIDQNLPALKTHAREWENKGPLYRIYRSFEGFKFHGQKWPEQTPERLQKMRAHYFGEISFIDEQVGKILSTLRDLNIRDETNIIFTSDHGDFNGDHQMVAKGPFLYDSLIRVPMIVSPGAQGTPACDHLTESVDIAPTLCDWAGAEDIPQAKGCSFSLMLKQGRAHRQAIISETATQVCYRRHDAKLIHSRGQDRCELFDLSQDPDELNNLAAEQSERAAAMRLEMFHHLDRLGVGWQDNWKGHRTADPLTGEMVDWEFTY